MSPRKTDGKAFSAVIVHVVIGSSTGELLYLVRYADGDLEHLTESEAPQPRNANGKELAQETPACARRTPCST